MTAWSDTSSYIVKQTNTKPVPNQGSEAIYSHKKTHSSLSTPENNSFSSHWTQTLFMSCYGVWDNSMHVTKRPYTAQIAQPCKMMNKRTF